MEEDRIRDLHRLLIEEYGRVQRPETEDGVRQLLATILSQNVADTNTRRAVRNLDSAYYSYKEVEEDSVEDLADVIRPAGLPETKARRLQNALSRIREETGGEYTLAFLNEKSTDNAREWLQEIKGVGPKTANVVLNFHFERPTIAVDTHVQRLAERFRLIPDGTTNEQAHEMLNEQVPDDMKYELHHLLIQHGKDACTAQSPNCDNEICRAFCSCDEC